MTYNPRLAKVKIDPHAKNQGQRSIGSNSRAPTGKRTDTHTRTHTDATKRIISRATRSIIKLAFHDADNDNDRDNLARILVRK